MYYLSISIFWPWHIWCNTVDTWNILEYLGTTWRHQVTQITIDWFLRQWPWSVDKTGKYRRRMVRGIDAGFSVSALNISCSQNTNVDKLIYKDGCELTKYWRTSTVSWTRSAAWWSQQRPAAEAPSFPDQPLLPMSPSKHIRILSLGHLRTGRENTKELQMTNSGPMTQSWNHASSLLLSSNTSENMTNVLWLINWPMRKSSLQGVFSWSIGVPNRE
jgi:hypothetical protein